MIAITSTVATELDVVGGRRSIRNVHASHLVAVCLSWFWRICGVYGVVKNLLQESIVWLIIYFVHENRSDESNLIRYNYNENKYI